MGWFNNLFKSSVPQKEKEEHKVKEQQGAPAKKTVETSPYETSNGYILQRDGNGEFIISSERDELELSHDLCVIDFEEYFEELLTMGPHGGMTLERDEKGSFTCHNKREQLAADYVMNKLSRDHYCEALELWEMDVLNLYADFNHGNISEEIYREKRAALGNP